jgi:hypothetical protein
MQQSPADAGLCAVLALFGPHRQRWLAPTRYRRSSGWGGVALTAYS